MPQEILQGEKLIRKFVDCCNQLRSGDFLVLNNDIQIVRELGNYIVMSESHGDIIRSQDITEVMIVAFKVVGWISR